MNFKHRPYNLLPLSASILILLFITFKFAGIEGADIAVILLLLTPLILLIYWLLYLFTNRLMFSKTIMQIHILVTIFTALLLVTVIYLGFDPINPTARRYEDSDIMTNYKQLGRSIQAFLLILLSGQLLYLANLLMGLFKMIRVRQKFQK